VTVEKEKRALALGSGITLLGVMRTLSDAGARVVALPDADRMARRSRRYNAAPRELAGLRAETLADALPNLPPRTVLFPCSDMWARAIAALPEDTRAVYPASIAPLSALDILVDKGRFRATLERLNIPHPTTRSVSAVSDLARIDDKTFESSFLKPQQSQQFFARFGVKALRFSSRAEAGERLGMCIANGFEMMLQEYIPGPPTNHYFIDGFVDRGGVVRAMFARRRLRMNPPDFGNSTLMVSIPLSDVGNAAQHLRKLLADIGYRGIFSAEFKCDERSDVFNIIEVNARPWWYVEFAARCGVNVCALALADALGEPVETISDYAVGRRCVFPYYDADAARAEMRAGRLSLLGWASSWLGSYQPVFRWSDPAPAIGEIMTLLGRRILRKS
jgi:D-aspartate ligase